MARISDYVSNHKYFDDNYNVKNQNYSNDFLAGLNVSSPAASSSTFSLADYSLIKSGTYGKLMKAYYAQEKAQASSSGKDSKSKLSVMADTAAALSKSSEALMNGALWTKKSLTEKDEATGEETTKSDYDWSAIAKALNTFIDDYNSTVEEAGNSNTKAVLRNAAWMTKTTSVNRELLAKVGISIGKGNKLSLDEEQLKKAEISDLKSLFMGHNSYASQLMSKGNSIANAAGSGSAYTNKGTYSKAVNQLASKFDVKE
ncbi:hypothetical protein [Pseudobutyrivibrio sp.]|uniref:hypothetical protein n=1 Tax=Pseudobutyrivibrio sp. TaxID=2014367 RepID=UPI0025F5BDE6|nr:hypothetical protein [Pseudobutyrivibrio sp.]